MLRLSQLMDLSVAECTSLQARKSPRVTDHCDGDLEFENFTQLYISLHQDSNPGRSCYFLIGAACKTSMPDFLNTDAIKPFARKPFRLFVVHEFFPRPVHHVEAFPSLADTGYFRIPFASEHQQKLAMREDDQSKKKENVHPKVQRTQNGRKKDPPNHTRGGSVE